MPRYEDRYGSTTRLYVGHLSSRTRSRDLEHIFSRYGRTKFHALKYVSSYDGLTVSGNRFRRVRDVDMKRDYAFVEFSDPRDADDARYSLDGRDVDGRRITVEFAKGVPRGPGGVREYVGRGPAPGSGRCFNCGIDGHWARDCKAGDWKNKCYRCGERGHIERNCQNSPKKVSGRGRSYSRSPVRSRSRSPRRSRRSRSFSRSPSYSRSRSLDRRENNAEQKGRRSRSPNTENPGSKRGRSPSTKGKRSPTPDRDGQMERSPSPGKGRIDADQDGYSDSPKETSPAPASPGKRYDESPYAANENGGNRSPSPRDDRSPVDDEEDAVRSPRGSPRYTNLGYGGNGLTPYLFGDYTFYLEENEAHRGYGSNMEMEDNTLYHQGYGYGNYFGDSNSKQQDYLENQQCGFCLGGNSWDSIFHNLENLQDSRSWDDWEMEETVLCQRMFGY